MSKFHINPKTGTPGRCTADLGSCPFGGALQHYETEDSARQAFELSMAAKIFGKKQEHSKSTLSAIESQKKIFFSRLDQSLDSPLTAKNKDKLWELTLKAYSKVKAPVSSFVTTKNLIKEINKEFNKNAGSYSTITEEERDGLVSSAFSFVSPQVAQASKTFEDYLADEGWDTRGYINTDPLSFEKTFVKSVKKAGQNISINNLAESFYETIVSDTNWGFDESDDAGESRISIVSAASVAYAEIEKDMRLFEREIRAL